MHTVRTTMRPWEEIEVSDAEYTDLVKQGLVPEHAPEPTKPSKTPSPRSSSDN